MSSSSSTNKQVVVDPFCFRQFISSESGSDNNSYKGTVFTDVTVAQMEDWINAQYDPSILADGYAPFCKHLFLKNINNGDKAVFTQSARSNILAITPENQHLLQSEYQARNDHELPVLVRYFPLKSLPQLLLLQQQPSASQEDDANNNNNSNSNVELPVATYLDIILYSREQIKQENAARAASSTTNEMEVEAPWGIVSIKAQMVDYELPMTPITAMRNALGKEEGGSGVPLSRDEYMKAVLFWKDHATIS